MTSGASPIARLFGMSDASNNGTAATPDLAGRGTLRSLDPSNPRDAAMVNEAARAWPRRFRALTDRVKDEIVVGLRRANRVAVRQMKNGDANQQIRAASVAATVGAAVTRIEAIHQRDDHPSGGNTINVQGGVTVNQIKLYREGADTEAV